MTRREEITKKALELDTTNDIATFVVAAKWADKTMIEKACEWMEDIDFVMQYQYSEDGCTFFNKDKFIKDFRKAMQNE